MKRPQPAPAAPPQIEPDPLHDRAARALLLRRMRVPVFSFVALLVMLAAIILLGWFTPSGTTSYIVAGITLCMILTILLFSMEIREEGGLMRFFAAIGFCWLSILLAMTMLDYLTR